MTSLLTQWMKTLLIAMESLTVIVVCLINYIHVCYNNNNNNNQQVFINQLMIIAPTHLGARERHTTTMIFSSDSEEEERHHNVTTSSTGAAMAKQLKQKLAEEWEIDEDDYCILTSPTTTKLVSVFTIIAIQWNLVIPSLCIAAKSLGTD